MLRLTHEALHAAQVCKLRHAPLHPEAVGLVPLVDLNLQGVCAQGDDALNICLSTVDELAVHDLAGGLVDVDVIDVSLTVGCEAPLHKTPGTP